MYTRQVERIGFGRDLAQARAISLGGPASCRAALLAHDPLAARRNMGLRGLLLVYSDDFSNIEPCATTWRAVGAQTGRRRV